jgi:hypothetical protein
VVRDNRHDKFCEADAKCGEVLEVRRLNPFIIHISPIHGIEIIKSNTILRDCDGTVQGTCLGVINLHIRPTAHFPNGCSRFGQSMRCAYRPPFSNTDRDEHSQLARRILR